MGGERVVVAVGLDGDVGLGAGDDVAHAHADA